MQGFLPVVFLFFPKCVETFETSRAAELLSGCIPIYDRPAISSLFVCLLSSNLIVRRAAVYPAADNVSVRGRERYSLMVITVRKYSPGCRCVRVHRIVRVQRYAMFALRSVTGNAFLFKNRINFAGERWRGIVTRDCYRCFLCAAI